MSIPILDSSAWREFRGKPANSGMNETTHLAKIVDANGKLHDCFVKLLPLNYPSLLGEAVGWLLARASGVTCVPFGAIVMVPLTKLRECMSLPERFDGMDFCPAWCSEIVAGKSVRQINKWAFFLSRSNCLRSKDARRIAAFDVWTDLRDRNYGNVIRAADGSYISIDHETILHDLLWMPTGRIFHERSLLLEAKEHLDDSALKRFHMDMAEAAQKHGNGLTKAESDITNIIGMIYPALVPTLNQLVLDLLKERSHRSWFASALGVIA